MNLEKDTVYNLRLIGAEDNGPKIYCAATGDELLQLGVPEGYEPVVDEGETFNKRLRRLRQETLDRQFASTF